MMLQQGVGALPIVDGRKHLVGIVSYIDLLKVFHPKGHVVDTMTAEPRTVGLDEPIDVAVDAMQSLEVRHLPVVDADKELVGMLSDRDLGTYVRPEKTRRDTARSETSSLTVSDVMSSDVICVEEDDDLEEVVELLAEHKIGAVPVVDGEGHVSGIVSYVDLLRDLSETPGAVR
jgi:acetoin utilization protein AcuB